MVEGRGSEAGIAHLDLIQHLDVSLALFPPPPPQAPKPHAEQGSRDQHEHRDQSLDLLELRRSSCWLL